MATEDINIRLQAQNEASDDLRTVRRDIDQVGKSARVTRDQTRNLGGSLGGVGRGAGMAGIQMQQFVGQVQGGVNPMIALSQQGADLGFVLGVPLLGAVVGIAASLATVLIPSLDDTKQSMSELSDEVKKLVGDYKDFTPKELAFATSTLTDQIDKQNAVLTTNKFAREEQLRIIKDANAEIATGKANILGEVNAIKSAEAELETLNAKRLIEIRRLKDLQSELRTVRSLREIETANMPAPPEVQEFGDPKKDPLQALRSQAEAIKMQLDPMKALQAERQKLQSMEANGLLTTQEYNEQLKNVTKRYQDLVNPIKQASDATEQFKNRSIDTVTNALHGIVTGAKSAKDAFRDMALSIINDIIKIQIRKQVANIASNIALPSFAGGGYTGMGARSGGVDGKGGFPAVLHPNETVVDHSKGQSVGGGNNVTVNVNMESGQTSADDASQLGVMIGNAVKAELVRQKRPGGLLMAGA